MNALTGRLPLILWCIQKGPQWSTPVFKNGLEGVTRCSGKLPISWFNNFGMALVYFTQFCPMLMAIVFPLIIQYLCPDMANKA